MPLDLNEIDKPPRTRWIPLPGQLEGVEVLVCMATPLESTRWRNQMQSEGIINPTKDDPLKTNPGRERAFFEAFARKYISDWRGQITPRDARYDARQMGGALGGSREAFEAVLIAIAKEAPFFEPGTNGSYGS